MAEEQDKRGGRQDSKDVVWRAAEYEFREKTPLWYLALGGIATVLVIVALWQGNFFFGVFIIFAACILLFFSRRKPRTIEFRVGEEGVRVEETLYEYGDLENFLVRHRPNRLDEIVVRRKTVLNPDVRLLADAQTAERARKKLLEKLPEMGQDQESLIDIVADWLGF